MIKPLLCVPDPERGMTVEQAGQSLLQLILTDGRAHCKRIETDSAGELELIRTYSNGKTDKRICVGGV
jgi:hypothetical protein